MNESIERGHRLALLARLLQQRALFYDSVRLRSGQLSPYYIDARLLTLAPDGLPLASRLLLESLPEDLDAVGGPTLGADPLVAGLVVFGALMGRPLVGFLVRQHIKPYGRAQRLEGPVGPGMRVALVDDTVTTGAALRDAAAVAEDAGLLVVAIRSLVDRGQGGLEALRTAGYDAQSLLHAHDLGLPGGTP